jgi:L-threonylcarbamoyladenylate synthase
MNIVTLDQAVQLLQAGKVGVIPTDTVYGLVACAEVEPAVTRMYTLKNREQKPGTLIAANTDQLLSLGVPAGDIAKVAQYWPGALSAVLSINRDYLTQAVGTLAMRVTADQRIQALCERTGPLISSSANQPGEPHATTIDEAFAYFGDTVDFYVDGGTIAETQPSTIIRPTADGVEVLRQGSVSV